MRKILASIIIVNYNGRELTRNLIESIRKINFPKKDIEIIVVDNNSSDGSQEFLRKRYPDIMLIENSENLGFDEAVNIGARASRGKYVTMLNNDLIVDKNWLKNLVEAIEKDKRIGIVDPRIFNKTSSGEYAIDDYGTTTLFHTQAFRKDVKRDFKGIFSVFSPSGTSLYRKDIVDVPFDKDYFAYCEDTYFGWKARLMGYEIVHVPESIVYHEGSATIKNLNKNRYFDFLAERNKIINLMIFYSPATSLKLLPLMCVFTVLVNLYDLKSISVRFKAYWWILRNIKLVLKKRRAIQKQRRVNDNDILRLMSCKFIDERNIRALIPKLLVGGLNRFSYLYCRIFNLRTIEMPRSKYAKY